jgi:predicted MFS family arabinose efflux permease
MTATVSTLSRGRLWTRPFAMLTLAELAYFTALGVAVFALPLYVTGPLGGDKAGAGLAFGAFAVSALLLRPYAGRLSDRVGRRPLLVGGAVLAAAALGLTATVDSLWAVVALRLLAGVAEASFFVAAFAALADLAPPDRLGEALSYNSLGLYLGLALGPPLGELLVETWSFAFAWVGAAVLALLAAVTIAGVSETRTARPTETQRRPGRDPLIHRAAIAPSLGFLASLLPIGGLLSLTALHAEDVGLVNPSLPLLLYGLTVVAGRVAFAKVPDRLPPLALGAVALSAIAMGLLVIAVWTTPVGLLAGTVLAGVGITFTTPAFFSAIFATATPAERGAASGTASLCMDVGLGFGPIGLGLVAQGAGIPVALAAGAGFAALGTAWSWHLHQAATGRPTRNRVTS